MWIPQKLKRIFDHQARMTQYLAEIAAGTDNQQRLINDKLIEAIGALTEMSKVLHSKLDTVVGRLDHNAELLNNKLDAVIAGLSNQARLHGSTDHEPVTDRSAGCGEVIDQRMVSALPSGMRSGDVPEDRDHSRRVVNSE
jgi:hypothetical protein